jgi:hypothetical protein
MRTACFIYFCLFGVTGITFGAERSESETQRVESLFRTLQNIQPASGSYPRIKRLVSSLVELDTVRTFKYFHVGVNRISADPLSPKALNMSVPVIRIVERSSLSNLKKKKIVKQINWTVQQTRQP